MCFLNVKRLRDLISLSMASSPQEDGERIFFFALGGLYYGEPWWREAIWGKCCFLVLGGDHLRFSSLDTSQAKSAFS